MFTYTTQNGVLTVYEAFNGFYITHNPTDETRGMGDTHPYPLCCPECGEPMCPECGCHDVSQISRITGYCSDVEGWNNAKKQELKDRHRVNISDESGMI